MTRSAAAYTGRRPHVHVLTNIPSYHQVDLFDAVARRGDIDLFVTYLRTITPGRQWREMPRPAHPHFFLPARVDVGAFYYNPGLTDHLESVGSDLLIVTQYAGLAYQAAMRRASRAGKRWVFWSEAPGVRFFEVKGVLPEWIRPLARRVAMAPIRKATAVWGVGAIAAAEYERLLGVRVDSLPYFSDLGRFSRGAEPYAPDGPVRFLFAGRYSFRKGFDVLVEAFAALAEDRSAPPWTLTVCGDGDMRPLLTKKPRLAPFVRDLGFKELKEMPGVMRAHDVFVLPTRYDGWGMVVPEAMGAGLVVLSSDQAGSARDLGTSTPGLTTFTAGDAGPLLARLRWILGERARLPEWGAAAVQAARAYDSVEGAARFSRMATEALGGAR